MSIGKSNEYNYLKKERFDFPLEMEVSECEIKNERQFIEFLLRNDWVQRKIGIKMKKK